MSLLDKVSSLFGSRVTSVTLVDGNKYRRHRTSAGRVLLAFYEALETGSDVYSFSGKLTDLVIDGEFTVAETAVVEEIRAEIFGMAQSGVVFTATRVQTEGDMESATLRDIARAAATAAKKAAKAAK